LTTRTGTTIPMRKQKRQDRVGVEDRSAGKGAKTKGRLFGAGKGEILIGPNPRRPIKRRTTLDAIRTKRAASGKCDGLSHNLGAGKLPRTRGWGRMERGEVNDCAMSGKIWERRRATAPFDVRRNAVKNVQPTKRIHAKRSGSSSGDETALREQTQGPGSNMSKIS